ncbi:transcription factor TGA3, partial [Tanacetum coccineum]
ILKDGGEVIIAILQRGFCVGEKVGNEVGEYIVDYINSGIVPFERRYDLRVVEQRKKESQLVSILQSGASKDELHVFVDGVVNHYDELFHIKADATKVDAFNLLYRSWKSPVESLAINIGEGGTYEAYISATIEGLEALENFLNQANHLRHRTLQQMSRILTMPQATKGLLALGEYFQRLRVLNSLWRYDVFIDHLQAKDNRLAATGGLAATDGLGSKGLAATDGLASTGLAAYQKIPNKLQIQFVL